MRRTLSSALAGKVGQRVCVEGWVHRRRRLASVSFLIVRDRGRHTADGSGNRRHPTRGAGVRVGLVWLLAPLGGCEVTDRQRRKLMHPFHRVRRREAL